jgi:hypothetical protein
MGSDSCGPAVLVDLVMVVAVDIDGDGDVDLAAER